jgi:hypothetical protein
MTFRKVAVVAAVLVLAGCAGNDTAAPPPATTTTTTTTTTSSAAPTTTTPPVNPDQQVCTGAQAIEARGFQSNAEELLQLGALGGQSDNLRIVTDAAFLSAAATAGDLQRAGESVVHILETCRQEGLI